MVTSFGTPRSLLPEASHQHLDLRIIFGAGHTDDPTPNDNRKRKLVHLSDQGETTDPKEKNENPHLADSNEDLLGRSGMEDIRAEAPVLGVIFSICWGVGSPMRTTKPLMICHFCK